MTAVPHLVTIQCHWCSKFRPEFRVHKLASNQVICDYCLAWHMHALEVLGGAVPEGCQECGSTLREMRDADPLLIAARFYVVPKDGIHQVLCAACKDVYTAKRADLYRGTQFGRQDLKL